MIQAIDFSSIPLVFLENCVEPPDPDTILENFEHDEFGGDLSHWLYLNDLDSFKVLEVIVRCTNSAWHSNRFDVMYDEDMQDPIRPCVAVFCPGGDGFKTGTLPEYLNEHLCYELSRLGKPMLCDLYWAQHILCFGAGYYQSDDDDERSDYDRLNCTSPWIIECLKGVGRDNGCWSQVYPWSKHNRKNRKQDEYTKQITEAVNAIEIEEDKLPVSSCYWGDEEGLFGFLNSSLSPDDEILEACYNGMGDMCQGNDEQSLIARAEEPADLKQIFRYLHKVDELEMLLHQLSKPQTLCQTFQRESETVS